MTDTRGTFRLKNVRQNILNEEYVPLPSVWLTPAVDFANTGYIGGGTPSNTVDRLNFANDTKTAIPGGFPANPKSAGAGGNTHGYVAGNAGYNDTIVKLVYATDAKDSIPATLSAGRGYSRGCNSSTNAYICAGAGSFNNYVSIVDRITASTDTCTRIPGANLPSGNARQSGHANTAHPSAAYIMGGVSPAQSSVTKLTFATEASAAVPGGTLVAVRGYGTTSGNGTNTYLYGGATNNNGTTQTTDILKTVYATDTNSAVPANMPSSYNAKAAACGSSTFGVIAGGYNPGPSTTVQAIKFTYSSESVANAPGMNLSHPKQYHTGLSARNGFAETTYDGTSIRFADGDDGMAYSVLFNGSNERLRVTGWNSNSIFDAYSMTWECWVKFTASDGTLDTLWDNRSSTSANDGFLIGRFHTAGHENKIEMFTASDYRITTDVEVPNDVWTHVAYAREGNNATARIFINGVEAGSYTDPYNYDATGTAYVGCNCASTYHFQGYISNLRFVKGSISHTDACLYKSNFTVAKEGFTSTSQGATASTSDYGTKLIMCNQSSITTGSVTADSLSINQDNFDSTVSVERGVFGSPPAATPTGTSGSWSYTLAPGVPNHGYYLGGKGNTNTGSTLSMKFSFATDTFDNSVRLTNRFTQGNGTGGKMASSPTHAYAAFGEGNPAPGGDSGSSWVRKVQYSNDTGSNAPNGPSPSYGGGVAGSQTHMYVAGGQDSHGVPLGQRTSVRKLTYSNDTWSEISQSNANYSNPSGWPRARFNSGGTQTHAYWGPGSPNTYRTSISKYTYATDTGIMSIPNVTGSYENVNSIGNSNSTDWYCARGDSPSSDFQTNISKFVFATDTYTFPTTLHDQWYDYSGSSGVGAINDGMTTGYWSGGHVDQSDSTSTLKITYATETASRGTNIPAGRTPSANGGGYNAYAGTSCREFGASTSTLPNLI